MRRQRGRIGLMAAALLGLVVSGARADVTTERSASLLVFPKVIADGTRDTIIQITNTSNAMVHAHCFYVNGALTFPDLPPSPINPPLWQEIDFDIWLTKQQPTHWVVSKGRDTNPLDGVCSNGGLLGNPGIGDIIGFALKGRNCDGAGIDPGRVPPVVRDFTGELKCVEVDAAGAPLSGNHLKGEATLVVFNNCVLNNGGPDGQCEISGENCRTNTDCFLTGEKEKIRDMMGEIATGMIGEDVVAALDEATADEGLGSFLSRILELVDVAKYNAIGVLGNENNNGDNVLCLGGESSETCPNGAEYNACPEFWLLNHFADGAPDPLSGPNSRVDTAITVVPCTQNFETQDPETVVIFMRVFNEFEQEFSAFHVVTCWATTNLGDIDGVLTYPVLGTPFAHTRMRSSSQTASGFFVVAKETHTTQNNFIPVNPIFEPGLARGVRTVASYNVHTEGERSGPDLWVIPPDQVPSP